LIALFVNQLYGKISSIEELYQAHNKLSHLFHDFFSWNPWMVENLNHTLSIADFLAYIREKKEFKERVFAVTWDILPGFFSKDDFLSLIQESSDLYCQLNYVSSPHSKMERWLADRRYFNSLFNRLLPKAQERLVILDLQRQKSSLTDMQAVISQYDHTKVMRDIAIQNLPQHLFISNESFLLCARALGCMKTMFKWYGNQIDNFSLLKQSLQDIASSDRAEILSYVRLAKCLKSEAETDELFILIPDGDKARIPQKMITCSQQLSQFLIECKDKLIGRHECALNRIITNMDEWIDHYNQDQYCFDILDREIIPFLDTEYEQANGSLRIWIKSVLSQLIPERNLIDKLLQRVKKSQPYNSWWALTPDSGQNVDLIKYLMGIRPDCLFQFDAVKKYCMPHIKRLGGIHEIIEEAELKCTHSLRCPEFENETNELSFPTRESRKEIPYFRF